MFSLLMWVIIGLFVAMLFVNVYFRARVLKHYRTLVKHRIQFGAAHVFDQKRLEDEVISKHPAHRADIEGFVGNMRRTIRMASVLIALITAFGAVLMYYRNG